MKRRIYTLFVVVLSGLISLALINCSRNIEAEPKLNYGSNLFYLKNTPIDFVIKPVKKPAIEGKFTAKPWGLVINENTGEININQSETGLKYTVTFTSTDQQTVLKTEFVISGMDYKDSIYVFTNNNHLAKPVFDEDENKTAPCNDSNNDGNEDQNQCEIDDPDLDDDGNQDEPSANSQGLAISKATGQIDLKQSLENGALGNNLTNGIFKDFKIYYRLNDASDRALNSITVRVFYFDTMNDIPANLLAELKAKQSNSTSIFFSNKTIENSGVKSVEGAMTVKKRPPYLVIVAR
ncbi:hypothetical protein NF867_06985 [Solitalea sp. MAHUQ-68]|uniref:Uncharacterized protein n=1 Tax=Solitalea agri TaxID=2953739 RepID=A0A9X2JCJ6_9SPHI|nr:hypothetical protein [Solitalea agri]MCO4292599.1 hypothetical protein [Solitalea agri]